VARWTDLADWRGPTKNKTSGGQSEVRGLVVHIAEGTYEGTIAWQHNPGADVSSHFVVGRDGRIAQVVDTRDAAWTQRSGNGEWLSVECAGFTKDSPHYRSGWERLTAAQVDAVARLLRRCHEVYRVPIQVTSSPSGRGLGHHSMGGPSWGHQSCPGGPIIAQKDDIVRAALGGASPAAPGALVAPAPTLREDDDGPRVGQLQTALNALGARLDVDDYFGPLTENALIAFQRRVGIDDDGVYGPVSARHLTTALDNLEDDVNLNDKLDVTDYTTRTWGRESLDVETALSHTYTYARNASDYASAARTEQAKQTALLKQLLAGQSGLTEEQITAAVAAGVRDAINPAELAAAIAEGLDHELDVATAQQAVEAALRHLLGGVNEAG
jgi:N-acetyl-anhydromuramyl-L-alanine amidase AmpD